MVVGRILPLSHVFKNYKLIAQILLKQENQLSGREIRFLRKHMGMKAKDFAERLGVKNVTVSRWEQGETIPPKLLTD